jgi:putative ABC transport system permease protein
MGFGSAGQLTRQDYEALRHEISDVTAVSPEIRASAQVAAGNQNESLTVVGASEGYLTIRNWPLTSGTVFTEADVRAAAKVALIGKTTAKTLFGDSDPVGQIVRIRSTPFTIVGLLAAKGANAMGDDQDDTLILPYTSAMVRLTGDTTFRSFTLQASSTETMSDVQAQITNLLRQRHRITNGKEDDFMVHTQTELSEMATSTSRIMTLLLGAVAGVSLVVGGIGVMNIMLVSVTERTREIGVRMAIGARGSDILRQFLVESVALCVAGGVIGILLGLGGAWLVSFKLGWNTVVSIHSVLVAFAFSAAIGIFFGFYPARKASQLDPIEALRYE